ncbi:response regulator transcription factor [Eubacterium sp.]
MQVKILIAEDEDIIRKGVAKYLNLHSDRFGAIYEAENGQEALDIIFKDQPDIVLLDIQMPKMDGITVMKKVANTDFKPLFIILSGYDEFKYAQKALHYGAKDYLLKPVRAADILGCINGLIDEYLVTDKENNKNKEIEDSTPLVREAKEYIQEHYTGNLTVKDVSEKIGISSGYLSTIFNQETGQSFVDYLNRTRIEHACVYLEQNYLKVYEIAYKVGFQDEKYFTKVFKKIMQLTPKEYINRNYGN